MASKDSVEFRRYEFSLGSSQYILVLAFNEAALKNLEVDPVDRNLNGWNLVFELEERGVVRQDIIDGDGNLIPADKHINEKLGARIITHRNGGRKSDPAPGEPGWERTDLKTGLVIAAQSWQDDELIKHYTPTDLAELNERRRMRAGERTGAALPGVQIPGAKLPPQP